MAKLSIVYWSGTGNTEQMAEYIKEGAESAGAEVTLSSVDSADASLADADVLAFGCPSMGAEELEGEIEDYIDSVKDKLSGKTVGLFGSYDWGEGQWMEDWKESMEGLGANVVGDGLIVNLTPEGDDIDACKNYGSEIVK
ncbi:MAG: flavodoxin [Andreesenia angusta]|nr:flavodoxin [Andreesenia angusta]